MKNNRAVFLDRDGVINHAIIINNKPYPPNGIHDLEITENAGTELPNLVNSGFILIGITNQPDVSRGTKSKYAVENINHFLQTKLPIQDFYVCYHDDKDNCQCRKPKPGLLIQAANDYHIDLSRSYMIGDRWKDIAAGRNAGCHTILIQNNYSESAHGFEAEKNVNSLSEAIDWILKIEDKND